MIFFANKRDGTIARKIFVGSLYIKGGKGKVRFRLSQHLTIPLLIAEELQKLHRQKYMSLELSFHKLFKNTTFRHLEGIGKTLS